jgi:hypothetical protein
MKKITAMLVCGLLLSSAHAQDDKDRWVTFKLGHNSQGTIEHQIDRHSIRQDGPYKIFWTRLWLPQQRQPLAFSVNEALLFWSQKFVVDCKALRFGSRFVDSNAPRERKNKATVQNMRWEDVDKVPAVGRAVCGGK